MFNHTRRLLIPLLALQCLPLANAVETEPVGFVTVELAGNSDSYVYIPFKRPPAFVGAAASLSSNGVYDVGEPFTDNNPANGVRDAAEAFTDTNNVITLAGTPGLTASQFVYSAGVQSNRYYVFLKTGTRIGMYYTVVGNDTGSVTVDLAGDDIAAAGAITESTTLEVIPYDTLGTIFPSGAGVNPSTSHSIATRQSEVLIPNLGSAGTNLASPVSYYYYNGVAGAGPGWRKAGVSAVIANDDVLLPDAFFTVRHNISTATSLTFTGSVQMSQLTTPVGTIANSTDQDNAVALPFATEQTLAQLKLWESGVFAGSSSHSLATRQDQVLVKDSSVIGKNKAAGTSYYYYTGATAPGPGWRKSGVSSVIANDDIVVSPTKVIVIRKKSTGAPVSALWTVKPPYVP
ncbi:MAG: TIGR02597 family protein [Prosthecobacter sp.]|jgi:uncharacterized protein (TIGR02597 family)|uniref:TIGR02597 family protein n=1 Tax=Prosthecobacter sp. TaxID=1965333 RepID=UPI0019D8D83C|nr:TIGR02597 family protein [Prosthecobacter sp.]MBE2285560.1 TIGR02597 family protein [Prosthecobacter sp.]